MSDIKIQTSSYAQYQLNFGIMLGMATVFFQLMLFVLDAHYQGDTLSSIIPLILSVGFINYGIYQFKVDNSDFISLSEGLKVGVGIALISAIISTIYGVILTEFLDPEFMNKTFEIAKQKGCEVTGISLSKNQIKYCREKAEQLGLDNQVRFELIDYREIKGKFDRIYSVGMFEHVGKKFYKTFFKSINKLLKDDGTFLLHTIGSVDAPAAPNKFINKYIFPGGVIPSFSDIINPIQKTGLIVADSETLIRHYDKTLESWLSRFIEQKSIIRDLFDEKFVKMWEFYLASCAAAFRYRDLVVFQLQIVKNFQAAHRTRDYIYS